MPENWLASRGRVLAGLVEAVSLYGAACLTCGGLAVFASHAAHANALVWFSAGFMLPIGPMYLYLASDRILERRLARWKRWREEELIGIKQYEELRRNALAWYAARHRFGKLPSIEGKEPAPASPAPPPVESAPTA